MLTNKRILITGGTGSLGNALVPLLLKEPNIKDIVIYSRDEMKQWEMKKQFTSDKVIFLLGDVRDKDRLSLALRNVDYVIHTAANKIVPASEFDPMECIKTNVIGAMNLIEGSIKTGVKKIIALSTDKASQPVNLYGASKLCSDKLFQAANNYQTTNGPFFSVVRYGNVIGSRGSILPLFKEKEKEGHITITDARMTRFFISLNAAATFVIYCLKIMGGGEIFIPKMKSIKLIDAANFITDKIEYSSVRPGEKIHEQLFGSDDVVYDTGEFYMILPAWYKTDHARFLGSYNSQDNKDKWIAKELYEHLHNC
jgi:FlaA1/EpsC-like NDP-sugar epimerase